MIFGPGVGVPPAEGEFGPLPSGEKPGKRGYAADIRMAPHDGCPEGVTSTGRDRDGNPPASCSELDLRLQFRLGARARLCRRPGNRRRSRWDAGVGHEGCPPPLPRYAVSSAPVIVALCSYCGDSWPAAPWVGAIGLLLAGVVDVIRGGW